MLFCGRESLSISCGCILALKLDCADGEVDAAWAVPCLQVKVDEAILVPPVGAPRVLNLEHVASCDDTCCVGLAALSSFGVWDFSSFASEATPWVRSC